MKDKRIEVIQKGIELLKSRIIEHLEKEVSREFDLVITVDLNDVTGHKARNQDFVSRRE